jgi:molybdopterin-guanine dinucleotide biosynthesis protein A
VTSKGNKIFGLVLAGGKSSRMGTDKSLMDWHGRPQRFYLAEMLSTFCEQVYISCRQDQKDEIHSAGYNIIADAYENKGPYGAILSAFKFRNDVAWLIIACDLPLLKQNTIAELIDERDPQKVATTFRSPFDGLPEPLITIWEPASHNILLERMEAGNSCPRKALLNTDSKIIEPKNPDTLFNANTPEDMHKVRELIKTHERRVAEI